MHARLNAHLAATDRKPRRLFAAPQIQTPRRRRNFVFPQLPSVAMTQPQPAQVHPVGVVEHPRPNRLGLSGKDIAARVAAALECAGWRNLFDGPALRQRERMPTPVRHRVSAERLQSGRIGCETKLAVAERQRGGEGVALDIVPCHERAPVDLRCSGLGERRREQPCPRSQKASPRKLHLLHGIPPPYRNTGLKYSYEQDPACPGCRVRGLRRGAASASAGRESARPAGTPAGARPLRCSASIDVLDGRSGPSEHDGSAWH